MDKNYTIQEVQTRKQWTGAYGTFQDYALKLQEADTGVVLDSWVSLSQKPETAAPSIGGSLFGHTESQTNQNNGITYLKFKKAQQQSYSGGRAPAPQTTTNVIGIEKTLEHIVAQNEEILRHVKPEGEPVEPVTSIKEDIDKGQDFDLEQIPF